MNRPKMLNERTSPRETLLTAVFVVLCVLLVGLLAVELLIASRFTVVIVSGPSMENTLLDGDILYASRFREPKRGDVVIIDVSEYDSFRDEEERNDPDYSKIIIKRLIATEGDFVKCERGVVYLKAAGEAEYAALDEGYVNVSYRTPDFEEVKVGEGEIFVLGDHRNISKDSEDVGCLRRSDVLGVVESWVIENKDLIGGWERFRSLFALK